MKKNEIKVGGLYRAKVSGKLVTVRVDAIRVRDGYGTMKDTTVYDITNLSTGRKTTFKSAVKFRSEVKVSPSQADDYKRTTQYQMLNDQDRAAMDAQVVRQREET